MSAIACAIVGTAVVGYLATKSASKSAKEAAQVQAAATTQAAKTQTEAQSVSTAMQLQFLRETRADIAEAVEKGLVDLETGFNAAIEALLPFASVEELNQAKELLSNPEAIMDRPSTRFQYAQGIEALNAAFSRTGGGGLSGQGVKAAQEYGQNFASLSLDAELKRLQPLIDIGLGAATNVANLQSGKGTAMSNLRISGATGSGNITAHMSSKAAEGVMNQGNIAAQNMTNQGNIAANNMINQANINTQMWSSIAQTGTNLALYKANPTLFKGP